jgi:hypothetical protein
MRPSIADLKRAHERDTFSDEGRLLDAAPVLLEIAASALALKDAYGSPERERETLTIMFRVLAKVRP